MKYAVIGRALFTLGLALGVSAASCGGDSAELLHAIIDAHEQHDGHGPSEPPECPGCDVLCGDEPVEEPPGCPAALCVCPDPPACPDICAAICAGEPEPETPPGCPIPSCSCD